MRKLLSFLTIIFLLLPSNRVASAAPKAQTGTSVQVTVAITRVVELNCDEDFGEACPNDYYPKFQIGGKELFDGKDDFCCAHPEGDPPEFSTSDWKRTEEVDSSQNPVQIHVELWDQDDLSADDELDIGSGSPRSLDVTFNLSTCTVQGIVMVPGAPPATSQGNDADSARIYYTVTTPLCQDGDTDGLLDSWEILGYDADGNGTIDVDLPTMGANSQRKDLFLEIDCLAVLGGHSHCPVSGAIQTVVQSFANAPVANVDGTRGIQLHVDIGGLYNYPALPAAGFATNVPRTEAPAGSVTGNFGNFGGGGDRIAEAGNLIVDWDGANGNPATNFFTLKTANFNSQRDPIFRYGLFVHQTNYRQASNDCTSGWAKGIPGVNFIVSLGGTNAGNPAAVPPVPPAPCWAADASGNSVGNQNQQAGTLMHEFGHTLGLRHGGGQNFNNKPNYLSVMNYGIATGPAATPGSVQFCNVPALGGNPGGCDYSRAPLLTLDEVNPPGLDECAGIGLGLGGFDWDGAGGLTGQTCVPASGNTSANVNGDFNDLNNNNVQDAGESNILSQLNGYDDWNNIFYPFNTLPNYQTAGTPVEDEADPATLARLQAILAEQVRPVLNVDKTGPTDAIPGDTLNYSIKVTNSGRGPALNAVLTDTKPDSTQAVFNLGTLVVGAEATHDVSFSVPCSVTDLTILKNSATATAKDILGNPVSGSDVVDITVHTPVLTLSKTATASVNAGEAITYTITYENTGSGEAENVVITDVLLAGVYYSQALDLGAGPKPDTMTLNPDGTRTLTWNIGAVPANSGPKTIAFTARPTLLALGGTSYSNNVSLSFQNSNGCVYDALNAAASTIITVVTPTRDPLTLGFWRTHPEQWTAEFLARIQATDQRYDNDGDGALSVAEATALLASGGNQPKVLQMQLLATYLNLATRRINANTTISSKTAANLGLINVRDAALFAIDTLLLPVNQATAAQYDNATRVLDEINNNKSEVY